MATISRTHKTTNETESAPVEDYKIWTVLAHIRDWNGFLPETYRQVSASEWRWETQEYSVRLVAPAYAQSAQ